jgi:4-carboxymuconolactone decarboxylase
MNKATYETGLKIRREVLGPELDQAIEAADEFSLPILQFITQYSWGEIWGRPGLDRRMRSLLTLAMLIGLDRPNEVRLHLRGAINNGVTKDEIRELILQSAIYCGAPSAMALTRIAKEVFQQMEI